MQQGLSTKQISIYQCFSRFTNILFMIPSKLQCYFTILFIYIFFFPNPYFMSSVWFCFSIQNIGLQVSQPYLFIKATEYIK